MRRRYLVEARCAGVVMLGGGGVLSKRSLGDEFSKDADRYYRVELFKREGFSRRTCTACKKHFWSVAERERCDDSSHTEYSFFKERPVKIGYAEFWRKFADFFKANGHTEIKRYPVVSRWRKDLYFTIASIQDFQRIEAGKMGFEYAANPLVVPQICLRFGDIENVGVTGRHFTGFMMAGQHSFDYPKSGYWKDRCIELNYEFITRVLGVRRESLVYSEDVWAMPDFSEFGPSLESFANGSELVNSVFTEFESVDGRIGELDGKTVDVGWGFERLLWFYTGYESAYEAVFHNVLERVRKETGNAFETAAFSRFARVAGELDVDVLKNARERERELLRQVGITADDYERKVRPVQGLYAVCDHTRTLMFAIADGALPSNIGGGYNLRIILRRALDFIERYELGIELGQVARLIAEDLKPMYPELLESLDAKEFETVIGIEEERYAKSRENARQIVSSVIAKGTPIGAQLLKTLYESNGITPEFLTGAAASKGIELSLPENAYSGIVQGDLVKKEKQKRSEVRLPEGLKPTVALYYDFKTEAKARVVFVQGRHVVLDETPFYPEGGGQAADRGSIDAVKVVDVQRHGDVIVHTMESEAPFKVGSVVDAQVDKEVRMRLTAHHTATHLISAASRKFLGRHVWQEGTRKEPEKAHIDIAHYERLSDEELGSIEAIANSWLFSGIKVEAVYMERGDAESRFGFEIYQGHGVPARTMRIVTIKDSSGRVLDAQACGGLHAVGRESILGIIKIINSYRSHDGIVRLEFVAGPASLEYFGREDAELHEDSRLLNSELFKVHEKILEARKEQQESRDAAGALVGTVAREISAASKGVAEVERELDLPMESLRKIADMLVREERGRVVLLRNNDGGVLCIAGDKSGRSAIEHLRAKAAGRPFSGGGSERYAEGRLG